MTILLVVIHVVVSLLLMLVVLIQPGKGADLAGAFGGGGSQMAFGARSATTFFQKSTAILFAVFVLTSLGLSIIQARPGGSVMGSVPAAAPSAPAPDAPAK